MRRWEEWEPTRDEDEFPELRAYDGTLALLFVVIIGAVVAFVMAVSK